MPLFDDIYAIWLRTLQLPQLRAGNDMAPLIDLLPENAVVVELGCFAGESSMHFLASPRISKVICVDSWQGGYDAVDVASAADMEAARAAFDVRTRPWRDKLEVFTGTTQDAAAAFVSQQFDLVYIDADHRYDAVVADIKTWVPLVRPGGYIAGHDYGATLHPDVISAVDACFVSLSHVFPDTSWAVQL